MLDIVKRGKLYVLLHTQLLFTRNRLLSEIEIIIIHRTKLNQTKNTDTVSQTSFVTVQLFNPTAVCDNNIPRVLVSFNRCLFSVTAPTAWNSLPRLRRYIPVASAFSPLKIIRMLSCLTAHAADDRHCNV